MQQPINFNVESNRAPIHVALLHWPVLDRAKNTVCTNVTNFDIHDIARASRVYGVERYFIVNKMKEQLMFVGRVLDHWRVGSGSKYNPKRQTALSMVHLAETLEDVVLKTKWSAPPFVVATSARPRTDLENISFPKLREKIHLHHEQPILLVFGTGFGLGEEVFPLCHAILDPIKGASKDDYRHLSVRSAVSICLDRLLGSW
ncbi:MAG: RNA methyltransferase [Bdellovibrionales bacterium]|nr:RNA methyltransferase [Bdellovibrionales bacterium]